MDKWPSDGIIEFRDVYANYRDDLEPVLKGITCVI